MIDETTRVRIQGWRDRLDPHPLDLELEEDRQRYVDLDAWAGADGVPRSLRGHTADRSAANKLLDTILVSSKGSTHLFSGFSGTGKTTELNRLACSLQAYRRSPGFSVLRLNARRYHGMSDALSIEHMAVLLVAGIGEAALEALGDQALPKLKKTGVWQGVHDRIRAMLDGAVTFKLGVADIKPALYKGSAALRDQLREALGEQLEDKLRGFVHGLVSEITEAIRPRQLVVLVDDLEKYTVARERVAGVYQEMADLFFLYGSLLKLPDCHTIYTVPPYLALLNPGIRGKFDRNVHLLPNVKVQGRPPEREPNADAIDALTEMMGMRVDLDALFGKTRRACMMRLALVSGGHLRDLITLMNNIVMMGMRRPLPLAMREVEDVIKEESAHYGNLFKDDLDVLLEVSKFGHVGTIDKKRLRAFADLMDQDLLLCYSNGDFWYDAHPILAEKLQRARETSSPGK